MDGGEGPHNLARPARFDLATGMADSRDLSYQRPCNFVRYPSHDGNIRISESRSSATDALTESARGVASTGRCKYRGSDD